MASRLTMSILLALGSAMLLHATSAKYLGCYNDNEDDRMLKNMTLFRGTLTPNVCIEHCKSRAYAYAGVQYGEECFCGNTLLDCRRSYESNCDYRCPGDSSQTCGGFWYQNVYETGYMGCYRDSECRMLDHEHHLEGGLTPDVCTETCKVLGYEYAGVQYGSECFCGSEVIATQRADEEDCNMACEGDSSRTCGGLWRVSIFRSGFLGCFNVNSTQMLTHKEVSTSLTPTICIDLCRATGYAFAGVQSGVDCYCGDALVADQKTEALHCDVECAGDASLNCGGTVYQSVFQADGTLANGPVALSERVVNPVVNQANATTNATQDLPEVEL